MKNNTINAMALMGHHTGLQLLEVDHQLLAVLHICNSRTKLTLVPLGMSMPTAHS